MEFTSEQQKIINSVDGFNLVIACPGSGKTTTMLERIRHMIEEGINPYDITMVTFTKAAAEEMQHRFSTNYPEYSGVRFCTIHSLCYTIIRQSKPSEQIKVLSDTEMHMFFYNILKKYEKNDNKRLDYKNALITEISAVKNDYKFDIDSYKAEFYIPGKSKTLFHEIYKSYEEYKKSKNVLDFDDLLRETLFLLMSDKKILERWQDNMPYIIIDEYQDTNKIQANIFYLLSRKYGNLCVVGDDDQSIYGFRNADSTIMLQFPEVYPDTKIHSLSTNYRSGEKIIEAANNLISHNLMRYDKKFLVGRHDHTGFVKISEIVKQTPGIEYVISEIEDARSRGIAFSDIAILYRLNAEADILAPLLDKKDIPINVCGSVKDIHGEFFFKDLENYHLLVKEGAGTIQKKEAMLAILNSPTRFLSIKAFEKFNIMNPNLDECIEEQLKTTKDKGKKQYLRSNIKYQFNGLEYFCKRLSRTNSLYDFAKTLYTDTEYKEYIKKQAQQMDVPEDFYFEEIEMILEESKSFESMKEWKKFLDDKNRKNTDDKYRNKDGIVLSTFHGSKGLEWKKVILVDINEEIVPHRKANTEAAIEEERRLFYVAMTRAKEELSIYCNKDSKSDFLLEIFQNLNLNVHSSWNSIKNATGTKNTHVYAKYQKRKKQEFVNPLPKQEEKAVSKGFDFVLPDFIADLDFKPFNPCLDTKK